MGVWHWPIPSEGPLHLLLEGNLRPLAEYTVAAQHRSVDFTRIPWHPGLDQSAHDLMMAGIGPDGKLQLKPLAPPGRFFPPSTDELDRVLQILKPPPGGLPSFPPEIERAS